MEEQRRLTRFPLKLPARMQVMGAISQSLNLVTENICAGGAFFLTNNPLPVGLKVLMEIVLKRQSGLGKPATLKLKGKVVRSQQNGMAVMFMGAAPAVVR